MTTDFVPPDKVGQTVHNINRKTILKLMWSSGHHHLGCFYRRALQYDDDYDVDSDSDKQGVFLLKLDIFT